MDNSLFPEVIQHIEQNWLVPPLENEWRKTGLEQLLQFLQEQLPTDKVINLHFICTHNSRRSHLAQLVAQTACLYFGLSSIRTFSGGTEATAFHPNAVAAVRRAGYIAEIATPSSNPIYEVTAGPGLLVGKAFSKVYDHTENPTSDFAAVMVCSHADENCPFIPGALARISLPYEDPKVSDGTEVMERVYDERLNEIGRDLFHLFKALA